ncbi:cytokeratin-75 [Stutzerimonas degradans]|nr:cytokeratin-75 [Stutzerimonas degradans]
MLQPLIRSLVALGLLTATLADAAELYRYTDERGVVVLDRHGVPPQHIGRGYEVLNEQGRVVRVVPPAPTAEEMQRQQQAKAREAADVQLLRLYASPDDVERARKRKLAELDSIIGITQSNLQSLRTQQETLRAQAAQHERAGREVPQNLLTQIANLEKEQAGLQRDQVRYQRAKVEADASFARDRERVAELLGDR